MATGVPTQWALVLAHPDLERTDFSRLRVAAASAARRSRPSSSAACARSSAARSSRRYTSTEAGVTHEHAGQRRRRGRRHDGRPAGARGRAADRRPCDTDASRSVGEVGEIVLPVARDDARLLARPGAHRRRSSTTTAGSTPATSGSSAHDGNLRIVGRLKEMYIRGGYNVYPAEVEAALAEHPAVARVAVVGVPDPVLGEIGVRVRRAGARHGAADARRAAGVVPRPHRRLQGTRPARGGRRASGDLDAQDRQACARWRRQRRTDDDRSDRSRHWAPATRARSRSSSAARCSRWSSRTRATRSRTTAGTSATTSTPAA